MLAAFGMVLGCAGTSLAQKVKERLDRASVAIGKGDFDGAETDINEVLKKEANNAFALNMRALINSNRKNYDQAIVDVTKAIELYPNISPFYFSRAGIYIKLQKWNAAISDLDNAIKYGFNASDCYMNRGFINEQLNNPQAAIADYRRTLELSLPSDYAKNDLAKKALDRLLSKQSKDAQAVLTPEAAKTKQSLDLANDLINKGDLNAASKILSDIFKTEPRNATVFYLDGLIQYKQGKFPLAYIDASAAIKLDPNVAEYYYLRGISTLCDPEIWNIGEKRLAGKDFDMAIKLNSNYADAFRERSAVDFFWDGGDQGYGNQVYIRNIRRSIDLNPKDGEAYFGNYILDKPTSFC